jgi:hypothetical protein
MPLYAAQVRSGMSISRIAGFPVAPALAHNHVAAAPNALQLHSTPSQSIRGLWSHFRHIPDYKDYCFR